jgi:adenosylhomocysteine nucleosidase
MIGITFALRSESSNLRRALDSSRRDGELIFGKIDNRELAIVHTGVGAKHCNERLEVLIHKARPRVVMSAGFAGAVSDELHAGDLIIGENFSDPQFVARASEILREARKAKIFTSSTILESVEQRNEIARESGAAAVDMETGGIANVCKTHGLPLLSLRVISDSPGEPFPAPMSVLFDIRRQRTNWPALIAYVMGNPIAIWRLSQFSQQIKHVRSNLTAAIVKLLPAL